MGSLYKRGKIWWIAYLDASGKRVLRSSGVNDERVARQRLERVEGSIVERSRTTARPTTVAGWVEVWISGRENWTADLDHGRLKKHVLPVLGSKRLIDVTQNDVRELVKSWGAPGSDLAPRTIRNIWWTLSSLFSAAVTKGLLEKTPCVLVKGDRPKIRDGKRGWRQTAVFSQPEAEALISDKRVPGDRQVVWALGFAAGLRLGEVSALRWRDYDSARKPLGCLSITNSYTRINGEEKGTKTETPRQVPVHPALAAVLTSWKQTGWKEQFGHAPKPEDLVIPNRRGVHLTDNNVQAGRMQDFEALSMRPRRFHDSRRTFISLAQAGGAMKDHLKQVTHGGASAEVMDLYTTLPWLTLCQAVLCLKLKRRKGLRKMPLQSLLQSAEIDLSAQQLQPLPPCPRRDSNPSSKTGLGHTGRGLRWACAGVSLFAPRSSDGDRSNVAVAADQGRRAQVLFAKCAGGAA